MDVCRCCKSAHKNLSISAPQGSAEEVFLSESILKSLGETSLSWFDDLTEASLISAVEKHEKDTSSVDGERVWSPCPRGGIAVVKGDVSAPITASSMAALLCSSKNSSGARAENRSTSCEELCTSHQDMSWTSAMATPKNAGGDAGQFPGYNMLSPNSQDSVAASDKTSTIQALKNSGSTPAKRADEKPKALNRMLFSPGQRTWSDDSLTRAVDWSLEGDVTVEQEETICSEKPAAGYPVSCSPAECDKLLDDGDDTLMAGISSENLDFDGECGLKHREPSSHGRQSDLQQQEAGSVLDAVNVKEKLGLHDTGGELEPDFSDSFTAEEMFMAEDECIEETESFACPVPELSSPAADAVDKTGKRIQDSTHTSDRPAPVDGLSKHSRVESVLSILFPSQQDSSPTCHHPESVGQLSHMEEQVWDKSMSILDLDNTLVSAAERRHASPCYKDTSLIKESSGGFDSSAKKNTAAENELLEMNSAVTPSSILKNPRTCRSSAKKRVRFSVNGCPPSLSPSENVKSVSNQAPTSEGSGGEPFEEMSAALGCDNKGPLEPEQQDKNLNSKINNSALTTTQKQCPENSLSCDSLANAVLLSSQVEDVSAVFSQGSDRDLCQCEIKLAGLETHEDIFAQTDILKNKEVGVSHISQGVVESSSPVKSGDKDKNACNTEEFVFDDFSPSLSPAFHSQVLAGSQNNIVAERSTSESREQILNCDEKALVFQEITDKEQNSRNANEAEFNTNVEAVCSDSIDHREEELSGDKCFTAKQSPTRDDGFDYVEDEDDNAAMCAAVLSAESAARTNSIAEIKPTFSTCPAPQASSLNSTDNKASAQGTQPPCEKLVNAEHPSPVVTPPHVASTSLLAAEPTTRRAEGHANTTPVASNVSLSTSNVHTASSKLGIQTRITASRPRKFLYPATLLQTKSVGESVQHEQGVTEAAGLSASSSLHGDLKAEGVKDQAVSGCERISKKDRSVTELGPGCSKGSLGSSDILLITPGEGQLKKFKPSEHSPSRPLPVRNSGVGDQTKRRPTGMARTNTQGLLGFAKFSDVFQESDEMLCPQSDETSHHTSYKDKEDTTNVHLWPEELSSASVEKAGEFHSHEFHCQNLQVSWVQALSLDTFCKEHGVRENGVGETGKKPGVTRKSDTVETIEEDKRDTGDDSLLEEFGADFTSQMWAASEFSQILQDPADDTGAESSCETNLMQVKTDSDRKESSFDRGTIGMPFTGCTKRRDSERGGTTSISDLTVEREDKLRGKNSSAMAFGFCAASLQKDETLKAESGLPEAGVLGNIEDQLEITLSKSRKKTKKAPERGDYSTRGKDKLDNAVMEVATASFVAKTEFTSCTALLKSSSSKLDHFDAFLESLADVEEENASGIPTGSNEMGQVKKSVDSFEETLENQLELVIQRKKNSARGVGKKSNLIHSDDFKSGSSTAQSGSKESELLHNKLDIESKEKLKRHFSLISSDSDAGQAPLSTCGFTTAAGKDISMSVAAQGKAQRMWESVSEEVKGQSSDGVSRDSDLANLPLNISHKIDFRIDDLPKSSSSSTLLPSFSKPMPAQHLGAGCSKFHQDLEEKVPPVFDKRYKGFQPFKAPKMVQNVSKTKRKQADVFSVDNIKITRSQTVCHSPLAESNKNDVTALTENLNSTSNRGRISAFFGSGTKSGNTKENQAQDQSPRECDSKIIPAVPDSTETHVASLHDVERETSAFHRSEKQMPATAEGCETAKQMSIWRTDTPQQGTEGTVEHDGGLRRKESKENPMVKSAVGMDKEVGENLQTEAGLLQNSSPLAGDKNSPAACNAEKDVVSGDNSNLNGTAPKSTGTMNISPNVAEDIGTRNSFISWSELKLNKGKAPLGEAMGRFEALHSNMSTSKSSPSGFSTALGKVVSVSDEALNKARTALADEENNASDGVVNNTMETMAGNNKISSKLQGFSTAAGIPASVSEKALNHARNFFEDENDNGGAVKNTTTMQTRAGNHKIQPRLQGFSTAAGIPVSVSENALSHARNFFEDENGDNDEAAVNNNNTTLQTMTGNNKIQPKLQGFSTAAGLPVSVSEKALSHARNFFEDENDESCAVSNNNNNNTMQTTTGNSKIQPRLQGFSTAAGIPVSVSEKALNHARNFLEDENDDNDEAAVNNNNNNTMQNAAGNKKEKPKFCGFSTAAGMSVSVSKKALSHARNLLEDGEDGAVNSSSSNATFQTATGNNKIQSKLQGFSTAAGIAVSVSEKALSHARNFLEDENDESCAVSNNNNTVQPMTGNNNKIQPKHQGFSTAAGIPVSVSEHALGRAKSWLDCPQDGNQLSNSEEKLSEVRATASETSCSLDLKCCSTTERSNVDSTTCHHAGGPQLSGHTQGQGSGQDMYVGEGLLTSHHIPVGANFGSTANTKMSSVPQSDRSTMLKKTFLTPQKAKCDEFHYDRSNPKVRRLSVMFSSSLEAKSTDISTSVTKTSSASFKPPYKKPGSDHSSGTENQPEKLKADSNRKGTSFIPPPTVRHPLKLPDAESSLSKTLSTSEEHQSKAKPVFRSVIPTSASSSISPALGEKQLYGSVSTVRERELVEKSRAQDKTVSSDINCDLDNQEENEFLCSDSRMKSSEDVDICEKLSEDCAEGSKQSCLLSNTKQDSSLTEMIVSGHIDKQVNPNPAQAKATGLQTTNTIQAAALVAPAVMNEVNRSGIVTSELQPNQISQCELEEALMAQEKLIRSKKRRKVRPCRGRWLDVRTARGSNGQSLLQPLGSLDLASESSLTQQQLLSLGVCPSTLAVNSLNSGDFRFYLPRFFPSTSCGVLVGDGATLVPDLQGMAGSAEFYRAFLTLDGVDPSLCDEAWVKNHYRWIVWKLAAYEVYWPMAFAGRCLTPDLVMLQLKYRYDREIDACHRSAIKKIVERDDTPAKRLVLCVASTITQENNQPLLEVTDGWYSMRAQIDGALSDLVSGCKVRPGVKLVTSGAELLGNQGACSPLEIPESLMLKLSCNSTRAAPRHARLGYCAPPSPLCVPLCSLSARGGTVGCVDVVLSRKYPTMYMEKLPDGACVFRTSEEEEKSRRKHEEKRQEQMEKLYSALQQAKDEESAPKGERRRSSRRLSRKEIGKLWSGQELAEAMDAALNPEDFQQCLSSSQCERLAEHKRSEVDRKQQEINRKLQEAMSNAGSELRNVTPVQKFRVFGCCGRDIDSNTSCMVTVWRPGPDWADMVESRRYKLYSMAVGPVRSSTRDRVALTGTRQSRLQERPVSDNLLDLVYEKREVWSVSDLRARRPKGDEFDFVGLVVKVKQEDKLSQPSLLYICDQDQEVLAVKVWSGKQSPPSLRPGQVVCASSLFLSYGRPRGEAQGSTLLSAEAQLEFSTFSTSAHACRHCHHFTQMEQVAKRPGYLSEAERILETLLSRPKTSAIVLASGCRQDSFGPSMWQNNDEDFPPDVIEKIFSSMSENSPTGNSPTQVLPGQNSTAANRKDDQTSSAVPSGSCASEYSVIPLPSDLHSEISNSQKHLPTAEKLSDTDSKENCGSKSIGSDSRKRRHSDSVPISTAEPHNTPVANNGSHCHQDSADQGTETLLKKRKLMLRQKMSKLLAYDRPAPLTPLPQALSPASRKDFKSPVVKRQ